MGPRIRAGLAGGLLGAICIWIYEAAVWVGAEHQMALAAIPANATGLVFGKAAQQALGALAYVLGTAIHFFFALAWGVLFAFIRGQDLAALRRRFAATSCRLAAGARFEPRFPPG